MAATPAFAGGNARSHPDLEQATTTTTGESTGAAATPVSILILYGRQLPRPATLPARRQRPFPS